MHLTITDAAASPCAACAKYPETQVQWQVPAIVVGVTHGQMDMDHLDLITRVKDQLKAFGWAVAGSSDGLTGGMDGIDRIVSYLSWPSQPHTGKWPWIVLRDGNGSQIIIRDDGNWGGYAGIQIEWSPAGLYAGGSSVAPPTATDVQTMNFPSAFLAGQNGAYTAVTMIANMTCTVDAKTTRIAFFAGGVFFNWLGLEKAASPVAGWPRSNFVLFDLGGGNRTPAPGNIPNPSHAICAASQWHQGDTGLSIPTIQGRGPLGNASFKMTTEGSGSPTEFNADDVYKLSTTNEVSGLPFTPVPMGIRNTYALPPLQRGHYGYFTDLYCIPDGLTDGNITSYPGWAVFNMMLTPWSGATPPRIT